MTVKIEQAADWLLAEREARRMFSALPGPLHPANDAEAYEVQAALCARLSAAGGPMAGAKIALTTQVMQEMVKYFKPIAGRILARDIHESGATLNLTDYVRIGVECEVAVRLGRPLTPDGAPYDLERVSLAVASLHVGIELVDDRAADYKSLDAMTLIADNAFNRGVVLGPAIHDWQQLDLAAQEGVIRLNGDTRGSGRGSDVMGGHPFAALAWLANHMAEQGLVLEAGALVLTGSLAATQFPRAGQEVTAAIGALGEAIVKFV